PCTFSASHVPGPSCVRDLSDDRHPQAGAALARRAGTSPPRDLVTRARNRLIKLVPRRAMDAPEGGAAFSIWEMSAEGLIFADATANHSVRAAADRQVAYRFMTKTARVSHRAAPMRGAESRSGEMTKQFEGKVALVTGAASGIGRASALAFAREGAK